MATPPYPWQEDTWRVLMGDLESARLPHAMLLHGPAGLGKLDFALSFAQALLCLASSGERPCGECKSCRLLQSHNHPDFVLVEPPEPGKAIRIDQIRRITDFLAQTAQQGGRRCLVIQAADALNINAANALLKSLEEPPADTAFMLVTASLHQISPTIRSRCRFVEFHPPDSEQALTWLASQGMGREEAGRLLSGSVTAPLRILDAEESGWLQQQQQLSQQLCSLVEGRDSVVGVAKICSAMETETALDFILNWLSCATTGRSGQELNLAAEQLIARLSPGPVFLFYDKVMAAKRLLLSNTNLNKALLWEDLLLDWIKCCGAPAGRQPG